MNCSFYTPIAYDYIYAFSSIISYYDIADEILLGIDKDRVSWSKKKYDFDEEIFSSKIKQIDKDKKIKIIEGDFHKTIPILNDTNERNYISTLCKKDNYIIGIDSDEILINPKEFKEWLDSQDKFKMDVRCMWHSVYKSFGTNFLITTPLEPAIIGTNRRNSYKKCRLTNCYAELSPLQVLHFSWGRSREEVIQKIENWSHSSEFDRNGYMKLWDKVTINNYKQFTYLHPLGLKKWWVKLHLETLDSFNINEKLKNEIKGICHA